MDDRIVYVVNANVVPRIFMQGLVLGLVLSTSFFVMNRIYNRQ